MYKNFLGKEMRKGGVIICCFVVLWARRGRVTTRTEGQVVRDGRHDMVINGKSRGESSSPVAATHEARPRCIVRDIAEERKVVVCWWPKQTSKLTRVTPAPDAPLMRARRAADEGSVPRAVLMLPPGTPLGARSQSLVRNVLVL